MPIDIIDDSVVISPKTPKLKGRPKGSPNKSKVKTRDTDHVSVREPAREPERVAAKSSVRKRTRSRNSNVNSNSLDIPLHEIPEGLTYEWKRFSTVGEEDHFYLSQMRQQGWEPVDPRNHPTWVPAGYDKPNIIRGGLILMERPAELTKEAREEVRSESRQRMFEAEQRLGLTPAGQLTREHQGLQNRVVKEWGRVVASD